MARIIILLLPLFITYCAAESEDGRYDIHYPCDQQVCYQIWKPEGDEIAIVRNGQIRTTTSEVEESKCILTFNPSTDEDESHHQCRRNELMNPRPGQKVSLQCVLLTSLNSLSCFRPLYGMLFVLWVDENGDPVQYHITRKSPCDVTLTVAFQNPKNASFRCMAGVNDQVRTSEEVKIRLPALRGKGRGAVIEEPQPEGGDNGVQVVGPTVGVLGAVVVMAAVVYVVNRRRTNTCVSNRSPTSTANYVLDSDEVIYTDVVLPAASDRVAQCV